VHLSVAFVGSEPFFKGLGLLVYIYSGALGLLKEFPDLRWLLLVFESHVVEVPVRQELALVRLDGLLGVLYELNDVLSPIHLPEDVLDDGMVLEHWQYFQVVLMLAEQLLPEGQAVNPLALHRGLHMRLFRRVANT